MSLVISPLQAAAILLPILCIQDLISIYSYRNSFHFKNLLILLPAAFVGILLGFFWFSYLSEDNIRIFLGSLAILFALNYFLFSRESKEKSVSFFRGSFWGTISGFTSFGIHAGGLPFNIYMLPQKLDHRIYVGTAAIFFGLVNMFSQNVSTTLILFASELS